MIEDGIGEAQIAFGVLKIDGVHLVRHGGGAHFTRHGLLFEIGKGDVGPDIAIQIQHDVIESHQAMEKLRHVIVGFDLDGHRVESQSQ